MYRDFSINSNNSQKKVPVTADYCKSPPAARNIKIREKPRPDRPSKRRGY